MAGSFIVITPSGMDPVVEQLQALYDKTGDLQPVLADIGEELLASHKARWAAEVDPDGNAWLPLSPERVKEKGHALILREHDYLRDLLNYNVTPTALYFGTPMEYGEYHQEGRGVPQRRWLGVSDSDSQNILQLVSAYFGLE